MAASRVRKPPSRQVPCRVMNKSVDNEEHSYVPDTENIPKFDGVKGCKITQKNKCMGDYRYIYPMLDPDGKTRLVTERDFHHRIMHKYRQFEGYNYVYPVLTVGNHEGKRSDLIAAPKVDTTFVPEEVDRMIPLGVEQILTDYDDRSLLFIASKRGEIYPAATRTIPFKTLQNTGTGDDCKPSIKSVGTLNEEAEPKPTKKQLRDIDRWKKKMEELNSAGNNLSGNRIVYFGCELNRAEWRDDEDIMSWFDENYPEDNDELTNEENYENLEDEQDTMDSLPESSVDECDSGYEENLKHSHLLSRMSTESCNSEEMKYESHENVDDFQNSGNLDNCFSAESIREESVKSVSPLRRLSRDKSKEEASGILEHIQNDQSVDSYSNLNQFSLESKIEIVKDISIQETPGILEHTQNDQSVDSYSNLNQFSVESKIENVKDISIQETPGILEHSQNDQCVDSYSNLNQFSLESKIENVMDISIQKPTPAVDTCISSIDGENESSSLEYTNLNDNIFMEDKTSPCILEISNTSVDDFETSDKVKSKNAISLESLNDIHIEESFDTTNLTDMPNSYQNSVENDYVVDILNNNSNVSTTSPINEHVDQENDLCVKENFEPTILKYDGNFEENGEIIDVKDILDVSITNITNNNERVNQENEIKDNADIVPQTSETSVETCDLTKSHRSSDANEELVNVSIETEKPACFISQIDACVAKMLEEVYQENAVTDDNSELSENHMDNRDLHTQNENSIPYDFNQEVCHYSDEQEKHNCVKDCEVLNCGINESSKTHRTSESTVSSDLFFDSIEGINSDRSQRHSFDTCSDEFLTPDIKEEDDCVWTPSNLCDDVSTLLRPITEPRDILDCSDESSFVEGLINRTEKGCSKSLMNSWEKIQIPLS